MISSKYNIIIPVNDEKYVFNLASQCLLQVGQDLADFMEGKITDIDLSIEELEQLYKNGILVDSFEFELGRLKSNINSLKYDRSRYGVFISMTSGCNLNCTYCYQDKRKEMGENSYLTTKEWSIMYRHFRCEIEKYNIKQFVVSLFGGEPMYDDMMCQIIVRDLRKLEKQYPNLKVQMALITNGTLFNDNNIVFYLDMLDSIQITLDGVQEIHDQFRIYPDGKGSFNKIIEGLKLIKKYSEKLERRAEICVRVNVNDESVDRAEELVDYLVDLGIDKYITSLSFHEIFDTQSEVSSNGGDPVKKNVELAKKMSDINYYIISKGIRVYKELAGPCIAKMSTGYAIDEKLNIYGCPGVIYSEVHGKLLENGEIKITDKKWYDFYLEDSKCIDKCKYAPICYGGCTWAKGNKENDCMKAVYDATIVSKLKAYILSKYV